jgi:predicted NACHT family NTPase
MMISHRNIGHHWQFSEQHRQVLTQYYRANKLLVACLYSPSNVAPAVKQEIKETLLLPIAEIQKHR